MNEEARAELPEGGPTEPVEVGPTEPVEVLRRCMQLTLAVGLVELVGGLATGSLSLTADAGHMLTDGTGLLLAFLASWAVRRRRRRRGVVGAADPETPERLEAWAALSNVLLLMLLVVALAREALLRLEAPRAVAAGPALAVAALGLVVNVLVLRWLFRAQPTLNVRAVLWHVVGDLLGSLAALTSGVLLLLGAWPAADAALALFICALLVLASARLLAQALRALRHVSAAA